MAGNAWKVLEGPAVIIIEETDVQQRGNRVVVRSRSQIVKPDALFIVFLGIKWAHDIVEKINHEFMGKTAQKGQFFKIG